MWTNYSSPSDLRLVLQYSDYNNEMMDFLYNLLKRLEHQEKYELCEVVYDEINFRIKLINNFYGFGEYLDDDDE